MSDNLPMPGFEFYVDQPFVRVSALIDYIRCPRRFFYHYGCGLIPPEDRLALKFGEGIHAALGVLLDNVENLPDALSAFDKVWPEEYEIVDSESKYPKRNKVSAFRMLTAWQEHHKPGYSIYEPVRPPKGELTPTSEQSSFEIPVTLDVGLPLLIVGRIDAISRHRDTGELWINEFKTYSGGPWNPPQRLMEGLNCNIQNLFYNLAAHHQNLPVKGTMFEFLEVKHMNKIKETPSPEIHLRPVEFRENLLDDALKLVRWKVSELWECIQRKDFPKNFAGCNPYDLFAQSGFNCDYQRLCLTPNWTVYKDTYKNERDTVFNQTSLPVIQGAST